MSTRIMIVDDHQVVLEGVKSLLAKYDDLEVVAACSNGREAVKMVQDLKPHIVVMDISMPRFSGLEATFQIKRMDPRVKIVVYTIHSYREFLMDLIKAGISAYVVKQNPISDLYLAIEVVRRGGTYFNEEVSAFLADQMQILEQGQGTQDRFDLLSLREREIFQLLAEGLTIKDAANLLSISPKTVETHKYHIMEKLEIQSMTEWAKEAIRRGIVQI